MASSYTTRIKLELQADGENPNSWGDILNTNVIQLIDDAVGAYTSVTLSSADYTLTVNSVPVGHAAHDIFCQVKVSAEGLVANTSWAPVGDDAGNYAAGSEDDLCVADTDDFIGLLNFFDPGAVDPDDTLWIYREHYEAGRDVEYHASIIYAHRREGQFETYILHKDHVFEQMLLLYKNL